MMSSDNINRIEQDHSIKDSSGMKSKARRQIRPTHKKSSRGINLSFRHGINLPVCIREKKVPLAPFKAEYDLSGGSFGLLI